MRAFGGPCELSAREFALLEALAREPGTVISRAKLEPKLIRNVRGVGYRLARID